jgi:DNA-directed RNA polymerase specialized sigma24 family protein
MVAYKKAVREAEDSGELPPRIPNYIGVCLYDIANRLAYRPNFINYTYRDDMVADGLENAIMCINNFDPEKSSNPFAYFTQVIWFAFIRRIHKEKKQTYVRHKVLENAMLTDTAFHHDENSDFGSSSMKDQNNDYINDFVEKYEATMEENKKKVVKKKKGLETFYTEDPEITE